MLAQNRVGHHALTSAATIFERALARGTREKRNDRQPETRRRKKRRKDPEFLTEGNEVNEVVRAPNGSSKELGESSVMCFLQPISRNIGEDPIVDACLDIRINIGR